MKVLFDTNVLLDFLLDRSPFADAAAALLSFVERGQIQGFACANTFTTIFYFARKAVGGIEARKQIQALLSLLDVAPVNRAALESAASGQVRDFEDAVIVESGALVNVDIIVTRNEKDFAKSSIPAHSPQSLHALLAAR